MVEPLHVENEVTAREVKTSEMSEPDSTHFGMSRTKV